MIEVEVTINSEEVRRSSHARNPSPALWNPLAREPQPTRSQLFMIMCERTDVCVHGRVCVCVCACVHVCVCAYFMI